MAGLILPYLCFSQPQMKTPENLDEVKTQTKEFLIQTEKNLGGEIVKTWNDKFMPLWRKMWEKTKDLWLSYIQPKGESIFVQIENFIFPKIQTAKEQLFKLLGKEIEQRKPLIEEEFQKEKEELSQEIKEKTSGITESFWGKLWERFKELIKQI